MNLSLTRSGEVESMLDSVLLKRQLLPCTAHQVMLRQVSNVTSVHHQEAVIPNYAQLPTPFAPLQMEMHTLKSHSMLTRKALGSLLGSRRVKHSNLLSEANPIPAVMWLPTSPVPLLLLQALMTASPPVLEPSLHQQTHQLSLTSSAVCISTTSDSIPPENWPQELLVDSRSQKDPLTTCSGISILAATSQQLQRLDHAHWSFLVNLKPLIQLHQTLARPMQTALFPRETAPLTQADNKIALQVLQLSVTMPLKDSIRTAYVQHTLTQHAVNGYRRLVVQSIMPAVVSCLSIVVP